MIDNIIKNLVLVKVYWKKITIINIRKLYEILNILWYRVGDKKQYIL